MFWSDHKFDRDPHICLRGGQRTGTVRYRTGTNSLCVCRVSDRREKRVRDDHLDQGTVKLYH
jgi:hypothetical protein